MSRANSSKDQKSKARRVTLPTTLPKEGTKQTDPVTESIKETRDVVPRRIAFRTTLPKERTKQTDPVTDCIGLSSKVAPRRVVFK
jgi:hypothetical protein